MCLSQNLCRRNIGIFESNVWAAPGVLWEKATRARSYHSERPCTGPFQPYFGCTEKLPQSTVRHVLPSNESYESKTGFNRTRATVLWVPLNVGSKMLFCTIFKGSCARLFLSQKKRVYPYPLGAGSARPNPKMGAADQESPLFLGFSVLSRGLRPWSQTMVAEVARPWGRARS